jgi:hypothetical protein
MCYSARLRAQKSEHAPDGAPDSLQDLSGAPRTVRWPRRQKLQRSNPNGRVTWLAHRTVRCAMRQQPPPNG